MSRPWLVFILFAAVKTTLAIDGHALPGVQQPAAARPRQTVMVSEHGAAASRQLADDAGAVPIAVLEHRCAGAGYPPVIAPWKGPRHIRTRRAIPLRLDWLAGSLGYTCLAQTSRSRIPGEYELAW